jgi:hypothetical protein
MLSRVYYTALGIGRISILRINRDMGFPPSCSWYLATNVIKHMTEHQLHFKEWPATSHMNSDDQQNVPYAVHFWSGHHWPYLSMSLTIWLHPPYSTRSWLGWMTALSIIMSGHTPFEISPAPHWHRRSWLGWMTALSILMSGHTQSETSPAPHWHGWSPEKIFYWMFCTVPLSMNLYQYIGVS